MRPLKYIDILLTSLWKHIAVVEVNQIYRKQGWVRHMAIDGSIFVLKSGPFN